MLNDKEQNKYNIIKKVIFGWFEYEKITRRYFVVLFNMIINYGIPAKNKSR